MAAVVFTAVAAFTEGRASLEEAVFTEAAGGTGSPWLHAPGSPPAPAPADAGYIKVRASRRVSPPDLSEAKPRHALAAWTAIVGAEHLVSPADGLIAYPDPFAIDPGGILVPGKQHIRPRAWLVSKGIASMPLRTVSVGSLRTPCHVTSRCSGKHLATSLFPRGSTEMAVWRSVVILSDNYLGT
jgi:hypothetical protein